MVMLHCGLTVLCEVTNFNIDYLPVILPTFLAITTISNQTLSVQCMISWEIRRKWVALGIRRLPWYYRSAIDFTFKVATVERSHRSTTKSHRCWKIIEPVGNCEREFWICLLNWKICEIEIESVNVYWKREEVGLRNWSWACYFPLGWRYGGWK